MDNYDKIYEQYELCKSYYLKIDRFYNQNFEISPKNELLVEKHFVDELSKLNQEFRSSYINLHLMIDNYSKQYVKLNTDNVKLIKIEIERYKMQIDSIVKLIERLT
jgi:hypothetical protein